MTRLTQLAAMCRAGTVTPDVLDEIADALEGFIWRPIHTAPRDGSSIRVVCVHDGQWYMSDVAWWDDETGRFENGQPYDEWDLTHWQPIEETP
jgi:hypothetical protein